MDLSKPDRYYYKAQQSTNHEQVAKYVVYIDAKTVVTPVRWQWCYCSFPLSHRYADGYYVSQ